MLEFAATTRCRRAHLLRYFGERVQFESCGNCDNCLEPPDRTDVTIPAQKLLSCMYRIREASGFSTGAHHIVDVLLGNRTEKVESFGHDRLSTFGVGSDQSKDTWLAVVSELLRLGHIEQEPAHKTLVLTTDGLQALKERRSFELAQSKIVRSTTGRRKSKGGAVAKLSYEEGLFEALRRLRKELADERGVPPYVVFSDATLREMAAHKPQTETAFRAISGVGDVKLEQYARPFITAIEEYESP
jgi:ATP-dependent DNA helicase RecQ